MATKASDDDGRVNELVRQLRELARDEEDVVFLLAVLLDDGWRAAAIELAMESLWWVGVNRVSSFREEGIGG